MPLDEFERSKLSVHAAAYIAELEASLHTTATALCSWRSMMEAISDGTSQPSRDTLRRHYDLCSDAIAACDRIGIDPTLTDEPQ